MREEPSYLSLEAPIGRLDFWLGKIALTLVVIFMEVAARRLGVAKPIAAFAVQAVALTGFAFLAAKRGVDRGRRPAVTLSLVLGLTLVNLLLVVAQSQGHRGTAGIASAALIVGIVLVLVDLGCLARPDRRPKPIVAHDPVRDPWRGGERPTASA